MKRFIKETSARYSLYTLLADLRQHIQYDWCNYQNPKQLLQLHLENSRKYRKTNKFDVFNEYLPGDA
jgi:hypothetical protein